MGLTEDELLQAVGGAGEDVSTRQLRRWRNEGLVPRAHRIDTGRSGSRYIYEDWVVDHVCAVARALRRKRSVDEVAVSLWWEGRWVNRDTLRAALLRPLMDFQRQVRELLDLHRDPFAVAETLAQQAEQQAARGGRGWGPMGQRLGRRPQDRTRVLHAMLLLALGQEPAWTIIDDDEAPLQILFERASGLERARQALTATGQPWPAEITGVEEQYSELLDAGFISLTDASGPIQAASDTDLDTARDNARGLTDLAAEVVAQHRPAHGPDVAGLASLAASATPTHLSEYSFLVVLGLAAQQLTPEGAAIIRGIGGPTAGQ
jgi:hypothetical protein